MFSIYTEIYAYAHNVVIKTSLNFYDGLPNTCVYTLYIYIYIGSQQFEGTKR